MIINRYIFKEIFPPFGVSLIFFSFIFIMTQLPEITNYVVNYKIGLATVGLLLLYSMPYFLQFTIPMSVMIGVLLAFLRMSGDMEIVALKAGGIHIYRLLPPVVLFGLLGTLLAAYMSIYGIPAGRTQSKQLLVNVAVEHVDVGLKARQFIDFYNDVIIYIHEIDNTTKALKDVFIEDRRSERLTSTIVAPQGRLSVDADQSVATLRLYNGTIHQVDLAEQHVNKIDFETYDLSLDMSRGFESLEQGGKHVQEMSLSELRRAIATTQKRDGAYYKALKEWHKKFSLPAACLIMALLAVPLGIRARSAQRAYGIALGLFFFLLYYVMLSIGWVLGESGIYPPGVGMWIPNVIILVIALILLMRTAQEKPALLEGLAAWLKRRLPRNPWARHACSPEPPCGTDACS